MDSYNRILFRSEQADERGIIENCEVFPELQGDRGQE